ncbi:HU family DNA-binding protein [Sulfobacillus thermosulfidooxidans]|uniref:HU family DNA-binding protein n=1 Tax=Sulfobacillus thermosulfidooxidans TaxID=28034 RepID=UPI000C1FBF41|nr:HU family DNA-binding protein [Sulfobacillus thermosulfidooxidans]
MRGVTYKLEDTRQVPGCDPLTWKNDANETYIYDILSRIRYDQRQDPGARPVVRGGDRPNMNKEELVRRISHDVGIVQEDVRPILNSLIKIMGQTLARGEAIQLVGLGTFRVQQMAARVVKHPQTGELIRIPARRVPVFRPDKFWRDQIPQQTG